MLFPVCYNRSHCQAVKNEVELTTSTLIFLNCQIVDAIIMIPMMVTLNGG